MQIAKYEFLIGDLKRCQRCDTLKDTTCFVKNKGRRDGFHGWCKECTLESRRLCPTKAIRDRELYEKNKARWTANNLKRRQGNRDAARIKRRKVLIKMMYGIRYEDLEKMISEQNFKCAICLSPISLGYRGYAIDHNHNTHQVRDVLCTLCNSGLGKFKESITALKRAIEYLEKWNSPIADRRLDET